MANQDSKLKLKELLKDMFQFDYSDLDFGIYKIMNIKRKEIQKFIDKDLIEEIKKQLGSIEKDILNKEEKKLAGLKDKVIEAYGKEAFKNGDLKEEFKKYELGKRYTEKLAEIHKLKDTRNTEIQIYNGITNFFSSYYDKGDFISKRRYARKGKEKYVVPYEGEETLFHWANNDQYYIKTMEEFRKFTFKAKTLTVNFRVTDAEGEKGNVKNNENRYFIVHEKKPIEFEKAELNIYFEYRPIKEEEKRTKKFGKKTQISQRDINSYNYGFLKKKLGKQTKAKNLFEKETGKNFLEKNLYKYTAKNTSDYFIHKNLKAFLEKELDFYIKNEILNLKDLEGLDRDDLSSYLLKAKILRNISVRIIDFLNQIEKFQMKLWEKKKFVIDTNYVVTIDRLVSFLGDKDSKGVISAVMKNKKQLDEWKQYFGLEVKKPGDLVNKKLPIDTRYFDDNFKWNLINLLSEKIDLEEKLDGLLIKSENWQAINLLRSKYDNKVKCIYIDPPFNSKSSEILYKNSYKHSSWVSLMENRISLAKDFLSKDGSLVVAIDENEQERLGIILKSLFPEYHKTCVSIIHNPGGIQGENFSYTHEYAYFIYPKGNRAIGLQDREENADTRPLRDVSKGNHLREAAANCFYPIIVKDDKIIGFGDVCDDSFHPSSANVLREGGSIEIYPIDSQGNERKWTHARNTVESIKNELSVDYNNKRKIWDIIRTKTRFNYKTVWTDKKYNSNTHGSKLLNNIIGESRFSFPKSVYNVQDCINATTDNSLNSIVMDFFAGSGTTAHAIMLPNKGQDVERKFILVEMAHYFDTVILPRVKKIAYSFDWKDGKPKKMDGNGIFFKYQELEQYEDSLENIPDSLSQSKITEHGNIRDYFVRYMLDFESRDNNLFLNIDDVKDPFNYKIKIIDKLGRPPNLVNVDLVETFNYLIGLEINKLKKVEQNKRSYVFVSGKIKDKSILVVWRPLKFIDYDKDKKIIDKMKKECKADLVYINGDSNLRGFKQIEKEFKDRLW